MFGFKKDDPFELRHYLSVASAVGVNKPEVTFVYYHHASDGEWWKQLQNIPSVIIEYVEPPQEVFGHPLCHYAHQSDIVRLRKLIERGGVYFDIDTICVRPLTPLFENRCVMGVELDRGLCNAVILAEPQSVFLLEWFENYRTFRSRGRDRHWAEHSVGLPARLAQMEHMERHITVLDDRAFFFPLWPQMEFLMESSDMSLFEQSYVVHLWETMTAERWLGRITEDWIKTSPCNYAAMARPHILLRNAQYPSALQQL